jgi:hypothetical protein
MPPTHCSLVPQAWAQAPQSAALLCRSTQPPLQLLWPGGQLGTQLPALQASPALQVTPQPPQFLGSVVRVTQLLLQLVVPGRQRHWPFWQVPVPQLLPQAPQLSGSTWVKVQAPAQVVWKGRQLAAQASPVQTWLAAQARPQPPQFLGSKRDTQVLPQSCSVRGHWQAPWEQLPPLQLVPQAPQLLGSVWGLMHWPPEQVR